MSKITITVTGDVGTGTTHISALVLWALLKFNSRPNYSGPNRNEWQQLAFDEQLLSREVADYINKGLLFDIVEVQTQPVVEKKEDEKDTLIAQMKREIEAMQKLLEKNQAKAEKLTDIEKLEDDDNQQY